MALRFALCAIALLVSLAIAAAKTRQARWHHRNQRVDGFADRATNERWAAGGAWVMAGFFLFGMVKILYDAAHGTGDY